jgi:RND family efflux transporter MFP subunit
VREANVDDIVEVTGQIAPPPRVDATVSSPVAGRISRVYVEEGDSVVEGALLATVEDPSLPAGKAEAGADVARARANKVAADQDLARQQRLVTSGIGAQRDLDEARARAAAAAAEVDAAAARAGFAAKNNARRDVRAPHAGVVLQLLKHVGESVDGTASTPVARVADVSTLEMHAQLAAASLASIQEGMPATIRLVGTRADITGKVVRVARALDPTTLLGMVRVVLDGKHNAPVGSAATGRIVTGSHPGFLVPASALRRSTVGSDELVVCDGTVARVRPVSVGQRRDGMVEISSGVRPGERVVSEHVLGLEEGQALAPAAPAKVP